MRRGDWNEIENLPSSLRKALANHGLIEKTVEHIAPKRNQLRKLKRMRRRAAKESRRIQEMTSHWMAINRAWAEINKAWETINKEKAAMMTPTETEMPTSKLNTNPLP